MDHIKNEVKGLVEKYNNQGHATYEKMVPIILKKGIECVNLSMFGEEMRNNIMNSVGEELVKKGKVSEAVKAFVATNNSQRLVNIGDDFSSKGMYSDAIDCYKLAQNRERLRVTGETCLRDGQMVDAIRAYKLLNDKEMLLKVGEECIKREKYDSAIEVFHSLENTPKLIEVGDKCVKTERNECLPFAERAYSIAGEQDKLNTLGDLFLKKEKLQSAFRVYKTAGNHMMMSFLRENFGIGQEASQ